MNKLESISNQEYDFVLKSYKKLCNEFILKKKDAPEQFIGGIPVNLRRDEFKYILDRSYSYPDYKYTTTPKVDGTRFLLFITESSPNSKEKTFYFIDRALNIYNLINKSGTKLETFNIPRMLMDGEMTFIKDGKYTYLLPQSQTEYLCFMVFDILYGPSDIYFMDAFVDKRARYRESVAMAGPMGGKLWDYNKRYNLLQKLLIPMPENNSYPGITMGIAETSTFFRIELKQILQIKYLGGVENVERFVYEEFEKNRTKLYNFLNIQIPDPKMIRVNKILTSGKLTYDGIIFTPLDTEYLTGNWANYKNIQYKWKPANEQTVDLAIKDTGRVILSSETSVNLRVVDLYFRRFDREEQVNKLTLFKLNNSPTYGLIPQNIMIKDDLVCEFRYNVRTRYFEFVRTREGKQANGIKSTLAAIKLTMAPIDLNILSYYFSKTDNKEDLFRILARYLTRKQMHKILICANKIEYISEDSINLIENQIKKSMENPLNEFKMIMGFGLNEYFQANLTQEIYKNTITMFDILNWKRQDVFQIELKKGDIITKFRYFNELKDIVRISSDKVVNTTFLNLNLKRVIEHDIQIKTDEFIDTTEKILNIEDADEKFAYESIIFYDPNKVFNVVISKKWEATSFEVTPPPEIFKYEIYIIASDLNSLNINNVDNFIRFYLNF